MAKTYRRLNLFMAKPSDKGQMFADLLADAPVNDYPMANNLGIDGVLYVKRSEEKRPSWGSMLDEVAGRVIPDLANRSSSAVLLLRVDDDIFAFTFGYGRYLIEQSRFVQDFGLRTALNTLDEKSLRSVDLHTLEDQPVQKKSQAARDSEVGVFGIDILRDVLRAVTGVPKRGVDLRHIAGGDAMFSFGAEMEAADLPGLARRVKSYYVNDDYKTSFSWVDNVRKIKDDASIDSLNAQLVKAVSARNPGIMVTLPEIGAWDTILGFSFTRNKDGVRPVIDSADYIDTIPDLARLTIEALKRDRLFVHDVDGDIDEHSVYRCIYFEIVDGDKTKIIFDGKWYEVDTAFIGRIAATLNLIQTSTLAFPEVEVWDDGGKSKIESEGDYNIRAAVAHGYFLLDKKLVKTDRTTSPIELCDLLTPAKQLVHVKHRKGGSAGLSHLFAQGGVAAEIMLGDKAFRKKARTVLRGVDLAARDLVPLDNLRSADYEIVFLILGEDSATLKENLPFFSKVNLSKAFENLTQRGFRVSIAGAPTTPRLAP
ncbi:MULTISPECIES: TIGR04141 family sporadically distributed protein [unclassified Caballeronia]|uniref:TIGR04141 family sporadically distributed protein n=1 Tax=unclassified Caballeronia TaxID=2646786 RepID=UPI001F33C3B1|nr:MULTISPECIES: TIGR04141 family sporadically distributed protein [unclassified Caballeronia]MCE4548049.1 TIGR04141 family sporadically distributed protein [Caballeronia sp. PC1]MCE4575887.1 TIGR04141 family sporadically distributed protein [Caballeronia sp. CLC5]